MNNSTDFNQDIAITLLESNSEFPVSFDLAWKWFEFTTKSNGKSSLIDSGFEEGQDFLVLMPKHQNKTNDPKRSKRGRVEGRQPKGIWLTIDCFKSWGMTCKNNKGKQIRKYFLECERNLKQALQISSAKPKSLLDLSPTKLYQLAAHQLSIELGKQPNPELLEGIDRKYLKATSSAAFYAYHLNSCEMAQGTKRANDVLREVGWLDISEEDKQHEDENIIEFTEYVKDLDARFAGKQDFDRFESQLTPA